jgi:hypothetical protein
MEKYLIYLKTKNIEKINEAILLFEDNKIVENDLSNIALDNGIISYRTFIKQEKIQKLIK